jgi:hypothetical protein
LGVYFIPQTIAYYKLRPMLFRPPDAPPRGWNSVPRPLSDTASSMAEGITVSYYGYSFDVPWKEIDKQWTQWNKGRTVKVLFKTGQVVKFNNPEYFDESPINSFSQRRALEQLAEFAKDATPDARSNKTGFSMIGHGRKSRQVVEKIGGASRDRTDDLIVANDALSQLSYSPLCGLGWSTAEVFYQRSRIGTNRIGPGGPGATVPTSIFFSQTTLKNRLTKSRPLRLT